MDDNLTDTPLEGNVALSHLRDLLFGDYLSREGLTEIAINRPGELHTKINGAWEMHASPVTLRQCSSFARALAVWNNDTIDETSPILSATLPTGERCQIVVPPACERNTISITLRKPDYFQRTHQSYIDAGFYDRVQGTEKVESKDGELSRIYLSGNIPLFMEKCVEYGKTLFVVGETGSGKTTYMSRCYTLKARDKGYKGTISVGRVQTPVLGMIVRRWRDNQAHSEAFYYQLAGQFISGTDVVSARWQTSEYAPVDDKKRLTDKAWGEGLARALAGKPASVLAAATDRGKTTAAPLPFNLLRLQVYMNRRNKLTAQQTLDITQKLKDSKYITYNGTVANSRW